jgi:DNA polymerase-3 subunit beta
MNFSCKKNDLLHGVQTVFNAVSNRNTLPILSNILFETSKDKIKLSATDLEVSIICMIPAEVTTQGSITIPAKKIADIVRELPNNDIHIKVSDNNVITLNCDKSIFKINGLPKDEYPVLPKIKGEEGINFSQITLLDMIKKVIFSVSTDETRYVLNGVLIVLENEILRMVSTDGHRLSFIEQKLPVSAAQKINNIVPAKALSELLKILGSEGQVNIQLNENQIIFSTADITLMSRLIDGQFPNYDQVIPKKSEKKLVCNTEKFTSATRRVALMASDKSNSIKYAFSQNQMMVSANTPEIGEAQEDMEINFSGDSITVAYNAKYILDVMKNIGTEEFILELTSNLNPGVFKPSTDKYDYLCVIMPMRI